MSRLAPRPSVLLAPPSTDQQRRASPSSVRAVTAGLITLMAVYGLLFGWLSLERYWAYQMHALDMGNMGQAAWNTVHGHLFQFTNMRLQYAIEAWNTTTRLSFHVEALFPVISLVYVIYPHPESLLVVQTVALALGAVPVFLLARDVLQQVWLGLVFALAYLLFPTLEAMNLYEFHPVALATPLLLFAFWFAWRRRYVPFVLCCLAAMGTKEEIGLTVAMFGLYVAIVDRERRVGLGVAAAGVLWSLFAVLVIEHHFRQPGTVGYLHTRYGYLGHGIGGALRTILTDPGVFGPVAFTWPKLGYLERLLAPVGFAALLAPAALLLGAPTFLLNVLSADFHMSTGLGDNSAELVAVVMIAAVLGTRVALRVLRLWLSARVATIAVGSYLLATALWSQHENGFTPLAKAFQLPTIGPHQHLADKFVAMIPGSAAVSTQDQLDPHLSSRRYLYLFVDTGRQPKLVPANYILLDVSAPTYPLPSSQLHDQAMQYIRLRGWGVAAADDGLILIKKGAPHKAIPSRFYTFAYADRTHIPHKLKASSGPLALAGYDVQQEDLSNHRVPNLAYTFYLRPTRLMQRNLQPVVYERMDHHLLTCARLPLGLAWLPTSRWKPGHTYAVRMEPMETDWRTPGTAELYVEIRPTPGYPHPDCAQLWASHGRLWRVGSQDIEF